MANRTSQSQTPLAERRRSVPATRVHHDQRLAAGPAPSGRSDHHLVSPRWAHRAPPAASPEVLNSSSTSRPDHQFWCITIVPSSVPERHMSLGQTNTHRDGHQRMIRPICRILSAGGCAVTCGVVSDMGNSSGAAPFRARIGGGQRCVSGEELFDVAVLAEGRDCRILCIAKRDGVSAGETAPIGVDRPGHIVESP